MPLFFTFVTHKKKSKTLHICAADRPVYFQNALSIFLLGMEVTFSSEELAFAAIFTFFGYKNFL